MAIGQCGLDYHHLPSEEERRGDKDIGKECIPGNAQNPGTFETLQECNESCGPRRAPDDKSSNFVNPITSDPQSKITEPDDEITRMQKLANIDK